MTDSYPPASPGADSGASSTLNSGAVDSAKETVTAAKDQAAGVAHDAVSNAKDVAGTAKDEAAKVASEAKKQAKDLYAETRSQLTEQAGVQQARVASGLRSLSDELTGMADNSEQQGVASDLVSQVADRAGAVASWLDSRDPGTLLEDVKGFARSRPGTFIALAAAAGIVAGRLTRSLASEAKDEAEVKAKTAAHSAPVASSTPTPPAASSYTAPTAPAAPVAPAPVDTAYIDNSYADTTPSYVAPVVPTGTEPSANTEPETWRP